MLKDELDYFIQNQEELVKQYPNKVLVIKDKQVVGVYDTQLEAYLKAQEKYKLGTFLIQTCLPGSDAYSVTISALNVTF